MTSTRTKAWLGVVLVMGIAITGCGGGDNKSASTTTTPTAEDQVIEQFAGLEAGTVHPPASTRRMAALLLEQIRHACSGYDLRRAANETVDLARQLREKGHDTGYFEAARELVDEIRNEPGAGLDCHHAALVVLVTTG